MSTVAVLLILCTWVSQLSAQSLRFGRKSI